MKIVLSGVETNNKGAELMLYAILQEIERKFSDATVYVELGSIPQGLQYVHTSLRIKEKPIAEIRKWCERLHLFGIARRLHINPIIFEDIYGFPRADYFLNDSGFYYSDQWNLPDTMIEKRRRLLKNNAKRGTRIVFLPQAFGPIQLKNTRLGIQHLNQYADIVMPREKTSYQYLIDTGLIENRKLKLYPDFTSLVKGVFPEAYHHLKGGICIIPNCRMLDKSGVTYEEYFRFIDAIVGKAKERGLVPFLLNHEGRDDAKLACRISADSKNEIEVVDELNGLQVKGLIAESYLVVTSRFHGVASALNSCVPCLATSWSHKYQELFNDYQQTGCVLKVDNIEHSLQVVEDFISESKNTAIRLQLQPIVIFMQEKAREMWKEVWSSAN